ncbi:hypothetical protein [Deinococcus sonorensis]|uniref:Lipoprotein n=2 Tax=Deinococcus sonorensis TaxID=309891 RepID=A0AAU7U423_9DEIO
MHPFRPIHLLWTVLPLLAGCGSVVGTLVPSQTIANPANLNGARLTPSSVLKVQSVTGSAQYDTSRSTPPASFPDLQFPSDVPFNVRPHAAKLTASMTGATLSGPCVAPASFTFSLDSFRVSVWDSGNQAGQATLSGTPKLTVTATRSGTTLGGTAYTLSDHSFTISADQATTERAITVLTSGGQNDVSASADVSAPDDALAGCGLTFTLGNTSVTLSNFH